LQKDFFVLLRRSISHAEMGCEPLKIISSCSRRERPDERQFERSIFRHRLVFAAPPHFAPNSARSFLSDCGLKSALIETAVTGGTAQKG
jgi:hypothetical protein